MKVPWRAVLLPFLAGATIESACVCWVHFSERGQALYTAIASMLVGTAQVTGFGEALLSKNRAVAGISYVLGYGAGTFCTVYLKTKGWTL